ncbi:MAG: acyl-CoA/acyl-ACP dehydrogenase [Burkholderiales bacterium]|nr:acyl-CoA/acyl-ACP dehydrogenase [Burkholderiales bacterium]
MPMPADQFLTREQIAIQQLAHEFARNEIRPIAMKLDHMSDPKDAFYMPHLARKFDEVGLHAMSIPEEYGGGGIDDLFTHCIVAEELGWGDRGVVGLLLSSNKITRYLTARELATPEQCRKWLTAYVEDPEFLIAQCMTEDEAGSENLLPYDGVDGGFRTTAVREGDFYVVNGVKRFISNSGYAKLYFMYVRTDRTKGINEGSTLLMIPLDTPGLSFGRVHDKMGYRLNLNREIIMENCRVPVENRLGPENYGISRINSHLRAGDGLINAGAMLGLARAAYEAALDYAETRKQSGGRLVGHQAIGLKLVEMYSELNAARAYVWQAARMIDNREHAPVDLKMPGSASMFAHEMACKVTRDAMEIFGGSGVMRELPIEMYLRNAYNMLHSDGGIIMKKLKVMRQLNLEAGADINVD